MEEVHVDSLTVVIAALLNMIIYLFWYSKWLFGPVRAKLWHHKEESKKKGGKQNGQMGAARYFYGFVVSLVIAFFLAYFEAYLGITTVTDGMFVGFILWLGFVLTTQVSSIIWEKGSFQLFILDASYRLIAFVAMSGLIGA